MVDRVVEVVLEVLKIGLRVIILVYEDLLSLVINVISAMLFLGYLRLSPLI